MADTLTQALMQSRQERIAIRIRGLDGQEVSGYVFEDVVVTDNLIATLRDGDKIDRVLPRK